jgi:hypothetical protein
MRILRSDPLMITRMSEGTNLLALGIVGYLGSE